MQSMTGYAYKELEDSSFHYSVEIKSYNARFLDMSINLPPYLNRLENRFRKIIDSSVKRGKIEAAVKIKNTPQKAVVCVDAALASAFKNALDDLSKELDLNEKVSLSLLTKIPGVICLEDNKEIESHWELIRPLFESALCDFNADRKREGENLKKDILFRVNLLRDSAAVFESYQEKMESDITETVVRKFREVLGDEIDERRALSEAAVILVKNTITEEIIRLKSHLETLETELDSADTPGRKIDFICQEINREVNTIGSKNQSLEVSMAVIGAKDALESIREQIRNIE